MNNSFISSGRISKQKEYRPGGKWYNVGRDRCYLYLFGDLCKACGYPFGEHTNHCPTNEDMYYYPEYPLESINKNIKIL